MSVMIESRARVVQSTSSSASTAAYSNKRHCKYRVLDQHQHPHPHAPLRSHHSCPQPSYATHATPTPPSPSPQQEEETAMPAAMDDFAADVQRRFEAPLQIDRLLAISAQLQEECRDRLQQSRISMLPSYQHTLPTGHERGDCLSLDVGGSTFRVALIHLAGKGPDLTREPTSNPLTLPFNHQPPLNPSSTSTPDDPALEVRNLKSFLIDKTIRNLRGEAFFDWMADRISDMLASCACNPSHARDSPLPMGLAWSFPIMQTSPRTGNILSMGKGFQATVGVEGQDLSDLIMRACHRKHLNVQMRAIVNDGTATLLSQAYRDPATRMSLILGTGTNAAVYFPVTALGPDKLGGRPESWHAAAKYVLVNTEVSMLGRHSLPKTRWDELLNAHHDKPDFQPLEYLSTGRYMGEIVRLVLLDAIHHAGLFRGHVPLHLDEPYALDSRIAAAFERDPSPANLDAAAAALLHAHPFPPPAAVTPSFADWCFVRHVCALVSRRAAAFQATALHALWNLRNQCESQAQRTSSSSVAAAATPISTPSTPSTSDLATSHLTVACDGTVVEKYPGFRAACQDFLDELCRRDGASPGAVTLEMAAEAPIFGAAVAVWCITD